MASSQGERGDDIPVWGGDPSRLDDFEEEVELYVNSLDEKNIATAGPRLARAHPRDSQQRKLAMSVGMEKLKGKEGPKAIVNVFRSSLADRKEADVWKHIREYQYQMCRRRGETIPGYIVREGLTHERALKALKSVDGSAIHVLPEILRGFNLLENSSLPSTVKISVLSQANNDYALDEISNALRSTVGDHDLKNIDRDQPKSTYTHSALAYLQEAQGTAWAVNDEQHGDDEHGEDDDGESYVSDDLEAVDGQLDDVTVALTHDIAGMQVDPEMVAAAEALQKGRRSFQEAKDMMLKLKRDRGFYPKGGSREGLTTRRAMAKARAFAVKGHLVPVAKVVRVAAVSADP